jgi:uncharacterized protein with gpF-like domain
MVSEREDLATFLLLIGPRLQQLKISFREKQPRISHEKQNELPYFLFLSLVTENRFHILTAQKQLADPAEIFSHF